MANENKNGRPCKAQSPFTSIFRSLIMGETQQEVANRVGVSRQNVGKWLSGETTPDINTLGKIADAYGVSTDYLLGRTDIKAANADLKAVCEYTGLSENAVENLIEIKNSSLNINLLLENERLKDVIKHLAELERLAISKRYWEQVIDPLINSDDFFDNLILNGDCLGKPKCKRYNKQYPDESIDCQNCGSGFRKMDSEYIYNLITREFDELLEYDLGIYVNIQADCSSCYQDNADLEHFKLSKVLDTLIIDIQENADFSTEFEIKSQRIRKKLVDELEKIKEFITHDIAGEQVTELYIENNEVTQLEFKALQTFLEKYDENFKLKKQKGAGDNGNNNPPKE